MDTKEELLREQISRIVPPSKEHEDLCRAYWDTVGKPLRSLGRLEDAIIQIGGIQRSAQPAVKKKRLIVMCADNGVVAEGVTQTGQEVTAIVAENFFDGRTCTSLMCRKAGCELTVVDIGMAVDTPRTLRRKEIYGTKNFAREPAMLREHAAGAVLTGIELVRTFAAEGTQIFATGEMGIGNTTTSSAVASVLLDVPVEAVTGRGAGLSSEGLKKKIQAIRQGIAINRPEGKDPLDVLSKVGGADIAGLTGVFLGGAICHCPVVIDGFISAVAALVAMRLARESAGYMLASHVSREPAGEMVLEALGKRAMLTCEMCLGEGSGAVALFPLLDMASTIYNEMGTFDDIHVKAYVPLEEEEML